MDSEVYPPLNLHKLLFCKNKKTTDANEGFSITFFINLQWKVLRFNAVFSLVDNFRSCDEIFLICN